MQLKMEEGPEYTFFQKKKKIRYSNGQQIQEKMFNITNHQGIAN